MYDNKASAQSLTRAFTLCAALTLVAAVADARQQPSDTTPPQTPAPQASPSPTPQASPIRQSKSAPDSERHFFRNILRDQRAIWTSPFRLERGDAKWLVPLGAASAALFATDHRTAISLAENGDNLKRLRLSKDVSYGGSLYATGGIAAAFYLAGRATGNARARETGVLGAEALINGVIVSQALKAATQRPRPREDDASGEFFDGGDSFPSGHATHAWALATVVANEYKDKRLVQASAYGLAAAISVSRFTARKHFLSDVLVGSALGYGIGHYVYRTRHDTTLDAGHAQNLDADDTQTSATHHSKLLPLLSPRFSRATRTYGLELAWNF